MCHCRAGEGKRLDMGLGKAGSRSTDRSCRGGPGEILVARQEGPRRKAENGQVPPPDPVAVDLVIPVSAGVTDQEQASRRREQINAGGPDGTADRVDDDLEALARQAGRKLSGIDDLVVGEPCLLGGVQVAGADGTDDPGGAERAGDAREAGGRARPAGAATFVVPPGSPAGVAKPALTAGCKPATF